jgi:hypothetical protein
VWVPETFTPTRPAHIRGSEERDDWLEQQRAFYGRVIAEGSHEAEPALRLLAEE